MTWKVLTLLIIALFAAGKAEEDNLTKAALEVKGLLNSVPTEIRPSVNNEPTLVRVQTFIRDIEIDDINGKLNLDILLRMGWNDHRLIFTTEGVDYVVMLNPRLAWLPDPFFPSGVVTYHKAIQRENFLRIYSNGNVTYSSRLSVNLKCPMLKDQTLSSSQQCAVKLASFGYTDREVAFEWDEDKPAEISNKIQVEPYTVDKLETGSCQDKTATGNYSCIKMQISLRRDTCA